MQLVTVNVDKPTFKVLFLSDLHYGHRCCDVQAIERYLRMVDEDTRIIIGGDICESKMRHSKGRLSDQILSPGEQLRWWKQRLKPLAGKIDVIVGGNHEERIAEETELDVLAELADDLGVKYDPIAAWVAYLCQKGDTSWHTESISIYVTHGASGAGLPGGKLNAAYRLRWNAAADVILTGHVHSFTATPGILTYATLTGRHKTLKMRPQWVVTNGSCLRSEGSYGERRGYPMQPIVQTLVHVRLTGDEPDVQITAV